MRRYTLYSTVRIEQTHSDVSVSHNDESHEDVRASDNEVHEVWIRRAKGRVSSTTTKFIHSCILRGSTASSRATVSYLPVKSNFVVPRKFDYMTVPDLTQFIKKDQKSQKIRTDSTSPQPNLSTKSKRTNHRPIPVKVRQIVRKTKSRPHGRTRPRNGPIREPHFQPGSHDAYRPIRAQYSRDF